MAIVRQYGTNKGVSLDVDQPMKDKRKTRNTKARAAIASHNRDTKYTRHKPPTREAELDPTIFDFQPIDFSRQKRHDFPPRIHSSQREVTMGTWKGAMTKWRKLTGVTPARMDRGNYTPPNLRKWIVPKLNLFGGVARRPNIIMAVALKEIEYRCKRIEGLENLKFKHISTTNNKPGYHGMGMAVDFDAPDNWMVHYSKDSWNLPLAFVREMEKMGFFWGMYFYENPKGHRKVDPMHFDFRGDLDSLMDSLTSPEAMAMAKEYEIPGTGKSIWEYSGKSGSGGVPEEVAMEKGYENSGTLIRREAEKFEAAGRFVIEKLPGNGGREVAMFIPNGVDPKKAKVTIHFHGTGSQNLGLEVSKERFASTVRAASAGNSILVYPLSAGYRFDRNNKGSAARRDYDDAWMSPGTTDDVQGLYEQALGVVRKQEPDLRVSEVVVQGHSAGGEALKNMAGEFDPGKDVKYTMRFLEASYGDWAQTAHDRLRRIHSDAKLVVCAIAGSKTDKKSRSLRAKLAEDENLEFEDVKTDHGGVIEEFPA